MKGIGKISVNTHSSVVEIAAPFVRKAIAIFALMALGACSTNPQPKPIIVTPPEPTQKTVENIPVLPPLPPVIVTPPEPIKPISDTKPALGEIVFAAADFSSLPNWQETDLSAARLAFIKSCGLISNRKQDDFLSIKAQYAGKNGNWHNVCTLAQDQNLKDADFWLNNFNVWSINTQEKPQTKLTSYFEPVIRGSFTKDAFNSEPLYEQPTDLLTIELGDFDSSLTPKTIVGRIVGKEFVPYLSRAQINETNAKPLVYTNMGDALSVQVQGSARIIIDNKEYRLSYTATNGHPFKSNARELINRGVFQPNEASADNLKKWFATADPKTARDVLNANPRTVFFKLSPLSNANEGPKGSQGVPLVAGGSLAIDPSFHPFGIPIFLNAYSAKISAAHQNLTRLVITQDTGGAIKGPIRGDLFWGTGEDAGIAAGRINHEVSFWVLLPKSIDPTLANPKPKALK